jgi:hypothetical protein
MRLPTRMSLFTLATLVLMSLCGGLAQAAPSTTLETLADKIRVSGVQYGPASFAESSALLESTLRQALINSEVPLADAVRPHLRLKATVSPAGSRAFSATHCTLRELLRGFAATWGIAATLSGNQILFSQPAAKPPL